MMEGRRINHSLHQCTLQVVADHVFVLDTDTIQMQMLRKDVRFIDYLSQEADG